MARAKKSASPPRSPKQGVSQRAGKALKELPSDDDEDPVEDLLEEDAEEVIEEVVEVVQEVEEAEESDESEEAEGDTAAADADDEAAVDGFVEADEEAPDLEEVLSKEDNARNLAIRREIERKLEERRLARDLDDLLDDD